ncbi:ROK family protein [Paramicrobacterium chengjingii]|uniref:ROK family protein n=1 Tax=Paramicrobacterium chengjingii TaxID=2769067 RepID=A0ABX6YKB3_9MICO|nr:ROK family protein [Microbacterium chengjingii]QPZ39264.1 ROK family protein [Microbacterium chengjingii]
MTSLLGPGAPVLAFDVGGTDLKSALVAANGELLGVQRTPTPVLAEHTETAVLETIARLGEALREQHPAVVPEAVGLIAPGVVDDERGIGLFAENLNWHDVPFRELTERAFGLPASFTHDVRAAGEAEYRLGPASRYRNALVVTIGTGIAAAIFIDGKPYGGEGYAGELGHSVIAPGGEPCACGGRGCLEAIASAAAITRRYNKLTSAPVPGAREVLERARAGDADAEAIWITALDALGLGLSHATALLAPEVIVLGGGLAQAGDALFGPVRERLYSHLTFHRRPELMHASIGQDAGLVGAAMRARTVLETP